jgi:hypothetical protein
MNMAGYTKLFNSILASTIWRSDDKTRIVWITLLAMADKDGICEGSIPGLADLARVSIEDCESALAELMAPDKYSRTTEFEGRRIEPVDGGWLLLNHSKYRAKMSEDDIREKNRQRQAKWRANHKSNVDSNAESQDVTDGNTESRQSRHTEAEAYTKTKEEEKNIVANAPSSKTSEKESDHLADSSFPKKNGGSAPTTDHARLMAHHADRVGRITDGAKQGKLIQQLLKQFTAEECIACYNHQLTESWRNNQVSWATVIDGTRGISSFVASQKPSEPVRSYNYVQGQPTQREAIEAEQKAIEAMGIQ